MTQDNKLIREELKRQAREKHRANAQAFAEAFPKDIEPAQGEQTLNNFFEGK